ncbi:hypothetical protein CEXT_682101 [Caerostris extrusa]|uniref:Uncharacterized protein n=1 Tax=Caerostris extrusa TaxID=172846 RepID=A0AAV4UFF8_CAEEX|nr:hypothetical protein CEXT_682101 [Caerostris extrusa]
MKRRLIHGEIRFWGAMGPCFYPKVSQVLSPSWDFTRSHSVQSSLKRANLLLPKQTARLPRTSDIIPHATYGYLRQSETSILLLVLGVYFLSDTRFSEKKIIVLRL